MGEQLSRLVLLQRMISVGRAPAPRTRQIAHDIIYPPRQRNGTRLVAENWDRPCRSTPWPGLSLLNFRNRSPCCWESSNSSKIGSEVDMPAPGLTFHLPPEARLLYLLNLCAALQQLGNPACNTRTALVATARQAGEIPKRWEVGDFSKRLA